MTHPSAPIATAPPAAQPRPMLGIVLMLMGFAAYSGSDAIAKLLTSDLPAFEVAWFRHLGLLAVALWFLARRGPAILRTAKPVLQIGRGLAAGISTTCFVLAVTHVPLADAVAVSFIAPFIVTVLGAVVLHETVGIRRWSAITIGFVGMLIVVRPGFHAFHPAILFIVVAACTFATRQVLSRILGPVDSTATTIAYTALASTVLLTVPMLLVWQTPTGTRQVLLILGLAAFAGIGEVLIIRALEIANAVILAPLQYSLILWSTILGWLVFAQLPDRWTLTGAAIIVASGIYTVHRERLAARRAAAP